MKTQIKEIWINKAEGKTSECFDITVNSMEKANKMLALWAKNAPTMGYDKCDFKVTFEDGEIYEGRYDLKNIELEEPCLSSHMIGFITWLIENDEKIKDDAVAYLVQYAI